MIMFQSPRFYRASAAAVAAMMTLALSISTADAQQAYPSPEDAVAALAAAVKTGTTRAILTVLGSQAGDIVESGDDVADAGTRQRFIAAYDAQHSIRGRRKQEGHAHSWR
jgi:DUF2950 family protein